MIDQAKRIAKKFGAEIHPTVLEGEYLLRSFPYRLNNSLKDYVETHFEVIKKHDQFSVTFKEKI